MFSLGALMQKVPGDPGATSRDESGLIDIKALAAAASASSKPSEASQTANPLAIFPFEVPAAPQPAQVVVPVEAAPELPVRKSRARVALLGAALTAAVIAVVVGTTGALASSAPRATAMSGLSSSHEVQVALVAASAPKPVEPAVDPSQTTATSQPTQTVAKTGDPRGTSPVRPRTAQEKDAAPVVKKSDEPKAPTPTRDACNGDLMCAMQRAARK